MLIKKYYFIKFTFIKKYVDERSKKIISLLLAERKMLINLKKKAFRANVKYTNYVAEYWYAFFLF